MKSRVWLCISIGTLGYLLGRAVSAAEGTPLNLQQPDVRQPIPTVAVEGVRDGHVYGQVHSGGRVYIGGQLVRGSGAFRVPAGPLLVHQISVVVPPGARFVASRRGSKYYSVESTSGQRLSPKNRIYFGSAAQAEAAGYKP